MAQANILIVDDTPQNSTLLAKILKQQYQVRSFANGKAALQAAQSGWADIILLDTKLPDIDGYEMCRLLRATPKTHDIKIIFLGTFDNVLKTRSYTVGGNDYITKPFRAEEVIGKVKQQVKLLSIQNQLRDLDRDRNQPNQELDTQNKTLKLEVKKLQQTQEQLLHLAFYDPATGLPNRNSFLGKIKDLLIRYQQQAEYQFAVFLISFQLNNAQESSLNLAELRLYLDRAESDKLLVSITQRIKECLSRTAILSRFENNQFAIVTDRLTGGKEESEQWLSAISQQLEQPFSVVFKQADQENLTQQVYLKMKAGIVTNSDRYKTAHELLQDAEIALHQTNKPTSSENYHVFQPDRTYQQDSADISPNISLSVPPETPPIHQQLKAHFLESIERNKIRFTYQPIFTLQASCLQNVGDVQIKGIEVLDEPKKDYKKLLMLTSLFQDLEGSDINKHIDEFNLELTANYLKKLQAQHPNQQNFFFTMACDANFLQSTNICKRIEEILELSNLDAFNLHLDILLKSPEIEQPEISKLIWQLADLGIKPNLVCKYLTYGVLKKNINLPFANFKLTSNLTSKIISADVAATSPPQSSQDIVYSQQYVAKSEIARIISLAHVNGIEVTAKAVQTQEQLAYLASVGCDHAQGDFLSQPLDSQALEDFLVWRI